MAPRIFITGVSGYVGGQVLKSLASKHPDYQITGLVRNEAQGQKISAKYPSLQIVYGNLDSSDVLVEQAKKADVIVNAADADNNPSVSSFLAGLSRGSKKGAFIQLSGAASIFDMSAIPGQPLTKIWDDITDLAEISSFDHARMHAITDQLVLHEGAKAGIRTAIVIPPMIYGTGEGPVKTESIQLPLLADVVIKRGKGFTVGEGRHHVSGIHVKDLADIFIFLIEQALEPNGGKAAWGSEGLYYAEAGSSVFADLVGVLAKQLHDKKIIGTAEIDQLSPEDANKIHPWAAFIWGANMRIKGSRLHSLGWTPKNKAVVETIHELLARK